MKVSIGGVTLNGMDMYQSSTYTLFNDGLKGWFDGVGVQGRTLARSHGHGSFDLPVYREERIITVSGRINSPNSAYAQDKEIERLIALCGDGGEERFVVDSDGTKQWAMVRLGDDPAIQREVYGQRAKYELTFKARDPRRYGKKRIFQGTSPAHHKGAQPAGPRFVIPGPRAAYTLTGPGGRSYVVSDSIPAGQTDVIDMSADGLLYRNGVLQVDVVSRADLWAIPAGQRVTHAISAGGAFTVELFDTWI